MPPSDSTRQDLVQIINLWIVVLRRNIDAHYHEASMYANRARLFTALNSGLAIALAVFSVSNDVRQLMTSTVGGEVSSAVFVLLGVMLLTTTTYQYFVRHSERQYEHKDAAILFSNLRRDLLVAKAKGDISEDVVDRFKEKYCLIVSASPLISRVLWKSYAGKYEEEVKNLTKHIMS